MLHLFQSKSSFLTRQVASLGLDAVALVRLQHGWSTRLLDKRHVPLMPENQTQPWSNAVAELEKLLIKSGSGIPITIVLANQWVRYKIIPALPALTATDKMMAVASHCFRESYGDSVDGWMIRVNPLPDGDTLLASAIDAALVEALQSLCKKYRCPLRSIQPYLMSGFNSARRQMHTDASCFVQVEAGRLNIALMREGAWQSIAGCGIGADWSVDLSALIEREMLLAGWKNVQPTVYFSTLPSLQDERTKQLFVQNNATWHVLQVKQRSVMGYVVSQDQPYAMAMSGVA